MDPVSQPLIKRPIAIRIPSDRAMLDRMMPLSLANGRGLFGQLARK